MTATLGLHSIRYRFARLDDADPVIGKFVVGSGQFDLRHVTRRALLLAHRAGSSRAGGSFCLITIQQMASQAF
jgi:hypothetical protein